MIIREIEVLSRSKSNLFLIQHKKKPLCFQNRKRVADMEYLRLYKRKKKN